LEVFRYRYRLPGFGHVVLGNENVKDTFENLQLDGCNEQNGVEEEAKDDRQLHAASKNAIVDECQGSAGTTEPDGREHQPRDGIRIPARIVKPQVGDNRAHYEAAQHTQCQEYRPKLIVERLGGGRFQLADDASDFCHCATL